MRTKIGIVGCGDISGIYLTNITGMFKDTLEIVGVCDLKEEKAKKASEGHGNLRIFKDMHELFADPSVEIVLNLTRPYEHFDVTMAAINAGKHVYSEKPLGATLEEGRKLRDAAAKQGVHLAGAPDTFLGAGIQTCRKLIDDGYIGTPVAATALWASPGHESWHPDPAFYYQFGGGPMLDMGPYYVTALVSLLGAVTRVCGMAQTSRPTRLITSQPHNGTIVKVETPTHIAGQMQFAGGVTASVITSYDVQAHNLPKIEVHGTHGSISVPDPNTFGGDVRLYRPEKKEFLEFPLTFNYPENSRGLGLNDMAAALKENRSPRAGIDLIFHVLEVMTGFLRSSEEKTFVNIESHPQRPAEM
ncbi:MAG: Gfo/Idh/MocA family oxidoreductase [Defluviitaleaceae bacterium]|nr:Gfo/Idh/MocA family oxidoreductase [Defluviitaleaceae bacterium]MCL2274912.1 Gfo/Idh/MocA family oxidoreductase [Defluviitaleaceae bacterium]